jgi:Selenocysteine lyase
MRRKQPRHLPLDMDGLDVDFLAFSGHKMLGPTASGGLLAKRELLDRLQPMFGGGDMIREVFHDHATWNDVPYRFEAGTMQVAQQVGLAAACDYLDALGMDAVRAHEVEITRYAIDRLLEAGAVVYGPKDTDIRGGTVSFWYRDIHPARPGDHPERRRDRDPGRASLRAARDASLRDARHRPGFVLRLQHDRGGRPLGRVARSRGRYLRVLEGSDARRETMWRSTTSTKK